MLGILLICIGLDGSVSCGIMGGAVTHDVWAQTGKKFIQITGFS